jgi:hypothetical protein
MGKRKSSALSVSSKVAHLPDWLTLKIFSFEAVPYVIPNFAEGRSQDLYLCWGSGNSAL